MEKKLVFTDHHQIQALRSELEKKCIYFNHLLTEYHTYQKFNRVSTIEDAIELIDAPIKTFDRAIVEKSSMSIGGLSANPEALCQIFGIDRSGYLQAINTKEKYSYSEKEALIFANGHFLWDAEKFNTQIEKFSVYADNPAKIELVNHFETLVNTLNRHIRQNLLSSSNIPEIGRACGLLYNMFAAEPFEVDYKRVSDLIVNLN